MKRIPKGHSVGWFLFLLVVSISCVGNRLASTVNNDNASRAVNLKTGSQSTIETDQEHLPLYTYLRRVPGLQVSGSGNNVTIRIRGLNTLSPNHEPLFIVDNIPIGRSYQQAAEVVNVADIKYISVLKDVGSTSFYGIRGSAGVILIKTKKKPRSTRKNKTKT